MKRVAYCTFGCRLNQYDTEAVRTLLEARGGYRTVPAREPAEVYVVNTCSVTARADASARKAIRRLHAQRPEARIVVTGCYAQRAPQEIAALPGVSLVIGAADRARIVEEVEASRPGELRVAVSPISEASRYLEIPISGMTERSRAFVKVQEGCDKDCAFCIVPQTRGRSRSRAPAQVLAQVRRLVAGGYREVVLTGVDLGAYGADLRGAGASLPALIGEILAVPGLGRLRLSSLEPSTVSGELIALLAAQPRLARHLHIPLQSGSDRVLARMRRHYTAAQFAALVRRVAEEVPGCGIGTDVICGFPGESDEDFRQTFEWLSELPLSYLHPFSYSERPGSAAAALGDGVPGEVRKRRTRSLKRLSRDKSRAFREAHVGATLPVLIEEERRGGHRRLAGWTDNYLRVELPAGAGPPGSITRVRLEAVTGEGLAGAPLCGPG